VRGELLPADVRVLTDRDNFRLLAGLVSNLYERGVVPTQRVNAVVNSLCSESPVKNDFGEATVCFMKQLLTQIRKSEITSVRFRATWVSYLMSSNARATVSVCQV